MSEKVPQVSDTLESETAKYVRENATFYSFQAGTDPHIERPLTAEHDADVAYHQRAVWSVAERLWKGHPEWEELYAEVKRLGEVRKLIRRVGGFKPCGMLGDYTPSGAPGISMCVLLEGHVCPHAYYETPMRIHVEEAL